MEVCGAADKLGASASRQQARKKVAAAATGGAPIGGGESKVPGAAPLTQGLHRLPHAGFEVHLLLAPVEGEGRHLAQNGSCAGGGGSRVCRAVAVWRRARCRRCVTILQCF